MIDAQNLSKAPAAKQSKPDENGVKGIHSASWVIAATHLT